MPSTHVWEPNRVQRPILDSNHSLQTSTAILYLLFIHLWHSSCLFIIYRSKTVLGLNSPWPGVWMFSRGFLHVLQESLESLNCWFQIASEWERLSVFLSDRLMTCTGAYPTSCPLIIGTGSTPVPSDLEKENGWMLIGDSKLAIAMNMSMNGSLAFCVGSITDCTPCLSLLSMFPCAYLWCLFWKCQSSLCHLLKCIYWLRPETGFASGISHWKLHLWCCCQTKPYESKLLLWLIGN